MKPPTRQQIGEKILAIKKDNSHVTKDDLRQLVIAWVTSLNLPAIIVFGAPVSPKDHIIADLDSYAELC